MKKYLVFIFILTAAKSFACNCGIVRLSDLQQSELAKSECIFIGEVIEIDDTNLTFKIIVTESLDSGDAIGNTYLGKNWKSCSPVVDAHGQWIMYGQMKDGFLRPNLCGISRSFEDPIVRKVSNNPNLYSKNINDEERKRLFNKLQIENKRKAITDLDHEINALRRLRDEK
ncbi:hypothetical protein [Nonlabens ponticola]|uniref:Uncharacterized protein n=1 Tax=Nonlabens ponticola TaxID=2496866 RepID=A0A3S9MZE0_9FLAO|nr:hypothetical protein [Nonlabens ponticola]AZQ44433.1 hypothetical protein EJ995_09325 [Nonlabens ponticola]